MKATFRQLYTFILILCLLLGTGPATYAQAQDSIPAAAKPVTVRQFDQEKLQELQASKDFQYFEEVKPDKTFLEKLWSSIKRWLSKVFYSGQSSGIWEVLIYVVIVGAIIVVIVKIQGMDIRNLFGRKAVASDMPYEVYEENIHEMDISALIEEAVQQLYSPAW